MKGGTLSPFEVLVGTDSYGTIAARWASRNFVGGGIGAVLLVEAIRALDPRLAGFHGRYLLWLGLAFILFGLAVRPVFRISVSAGMALSGVATACVVGLFTAGVGPALSDSVAQSAILVATTAPILFPRRYAILVLAGDLAGTAWSIFAWSGLPVPGDRVMILTVQTAMISGVTFWFSATLRRLGDSERQAMVETEKALAELAEVDERRRNFLHQMSHQLRTPLNAIIGFSQLLRSGMAGPLTDRQREYVDDIGTSGSHLLALVDEVLDIGKIDEGLLELRPRPFPASRAAQACMSLCREQAKRNGVGLELQVLGSGQLVADERKVTQILLNLVSNGIKATPAGGRVEMVVSREGAWFVYTVSDTGPGVPAADRERIFDAFEQGPAGLTAGTGLGLAVARNLAQAHGGTLTVDGGGPGARFVLRLPVQVAENALRAGRDAVSPSIRRRSILDDNSWLEVLAGRDGLARYRAVWAAVIILSEMALFWLLYLSGARQPFHADRWIWLTPIGLVLGLFSARPRTRYSAGQLHSLGILVLPLIGLAAWRGGDGYIPPAGALLLSAGLGSFGAFRLKKAILLAVEAAVVYGAVVASERDHRVALIQWGLTMGLLAAGAILCRWLLGFLPALVESEDRARRNAQLLKAHLEDAGRHRSEFLASMSHELRTPLNAIIGFAEALDQGVFGPLEPKAAEYVSDIASSGRHLLALINDILDLAKVSAGKLVLTERSTTLEEILDAACTGLQARAATKGVGFSLNCDDATELIVDPYRMTQAVRCVVSNAVEFTGPSGTVTICGKVERGELRVEVCDDGPGIEETDHERIFAAFEYAGDHRVHLGTGIGLALARRLVELHGGTLAVDSAVGEGSRFVLRIPVVERSKVAT